MHRNEPSASGNRNHSSGSADGSRDRCSFRKCGRSGWRLQQRECAECRGSHKGCGSLDGFRCADRCNHRRSGSEADISFSKGCRGCRKIPLADWAKAGLFNTGDGILGRMVYAVADGNMSVEEKFAYAFSPEHMAMDFLGGAAMYGMSKVLPKIREKLPWNKISNETSYGKSSKNYKSMADYLTNIESRNGKFYTDKVTIDQIGQIEARGEDFSLLNKKNMSSRASAEGGTSIVYKYSDELGTKYLIHEVTDARGYIIHRDFDAVRISSGQLINKGH